MESTGIKELDKAFGGGIDEGKILLVKAPPNTGKIVLGYTFLQQQMVTNRCCFYLFYKESMKEAVRDITHFGINPEKMYFINSNMVYEQDSPANISVCDLYNPGSLDCIDDILRKSKVPVRGLITALSQIFIGKSFSVAFYLLSHLRKLIENYKSCIFLLTMERGLVGDNEIRDVEDMVDVVLELVPKTSTEGTLTIQKSYKPVLKKSFVYKLSPNKFSLI